MKKVTVLFSMVMIFLSVGTSNASLTTIGTATYMGSDYNLIYEDDSIDGGLVWLDYTNDTDIWQNHMNWASGLGSNLTVDLDPGYSTDIDWGIDWRLPLTQNQTSGYNQTGSEMGHLYYESLGNVGYSDPGWGLNNVGDFNNVQSLTYWSGTEYSPIPDYAWLFFFYDGYQTNVNKDSNYYALAVRPGQVSAVPIPSAIWLLGSGLAGLGIFRNKKRRHSVI